jgi:hypothetical protein
VSVLVAFVGASGTSADAGWSDDDVDGWARDIAASTDARACSASMRTSGAPRVITRQVAASHIHAGSSQPGRSSTKSAAEPRRRAASWTRNS